MGRSVVAVSVLTLAALASASPTVADNALDNEDRVVLVAPVLAPPRDSRNHGTDRARQFPILVLLAPKDQPERPRADHEPKALKGQQEPIYVQKLEDQNSALPILNRQKRHHGGGWGGKGPGIAIIIEQGGGGGGYSHHHHGGHWGGGGGYGPPIYGGGYGGYGGYGGGYGGQAVATASATAYSSSYGYGKR